MAGGVRTPTGPLAELGDVSSPLDMRNGVNPSYQTFGYCLPAAWRAPSACHTMNVLYPQKFGLFFIIGL